MNTSQMIHSAESIKIKNVLVPSASGDFYSTEITIWGKDEERLTISVYGERSDDPKPLIMTFGG